MADSAPTSAPPGAGSKILVVDDDEVFLSTVEAILSVHFDVTVCHGPLHALSLNLDAFDVVCADYSMPDMTGVELLRLVAERSTGTCGLLMTGVDDFYDHVTSEERPPVIFKPLSPERLLSTVGQLASIAQMKRATTAMVDRRSRF